MYTHTLALMQKSHGHSVSVIIPFIQYQNSARMIPHYEYEGVDVFQFKETANPGDTDLYTGKKKPEGLNAFKDLLINLKPDVIHFHELNLGTGLTVEHVKLAKKTGAKILVTMHLSFFICNTNTLIYKNHLCEGYIKQTDCTDCTYHTIHKMPQPVAACLAAVSNWALAAGVPGFLNKGKIKTLLSIPAIIRRKKNDLDDFINNIDKFISVSNWYREILIKNGVPENKIEVIPQALTTEKIMLNVENKNSDADLIRLVFIGRIQHTKGVHLLIEAMKNFDTTQVQLDVYGKEEQSGYFNDCINEIKKSANIQWKGYLERQQVTTVLSGYDMLCLPSLFSEMSPLVIQEAFAAGIPVLASRVYGNLEQIIHGKNGLICDFNSSKNIAAQIKSLVSNHQILHQLKKNIVSPDDFIGVYKKYMELYTNGV